MLVSADTALRGVRVVFTAFFVVNDELPFLPREFLLADTAVVALIRCAPAHRLSSACPILPSLGIAIRRGAAKDATKQPRFRFRLVI